MFLVPSWTTAVWCEHKLATTMIPGDISSKMHIITRSFHVTLSFSPSPEPDVASQVAVAFNMTTTHSYGSELDAVVARGIHSQDHDTFVQK